MTKKNYLKLILTTTLLFFAAIFAAAKINATAPDVNFGNATALTWKGFSGEEDFWDLGTDKIDVWTSITGIADYTNSTDTPEFVAYNGVKAIYTGHTESYIYWVFDGVLEEVHFYNYKFHKSETVAYADLVDVQVDVNPNSDYENGYNTARDNFAVNIDGEWVSAVDYGVVKFDEAKTEYGIHYNNEWLTAINYANIISNQSFDDGYDLGVEASYFLDKHELYKEVFNIDYLPKITYEKRGWEEKVVYLLPRKNYYVEGTSAYIKINDDSYYFDENFNIKKDIISISEDDLAVLETSVEFYVKNRLMPAGKYRIFLERDVDSRYLHIRSLDDPTIYTRQRTYYYSYVGGHDNYTIVLDFEDINYNSISYKYENKNYHHQLFLDGKKTIPPISPTKDGYIFVGWFAEDEDVAYDFNQELENDLILYAMFGLSVNVNFETNGGNKIDPLEVLSGQPLNIDDPIKDGYNFVGWYKDIELTEVLDVIPEVDLTVYAKWELKEHTITFNYNNEVYSTSIYDVENELIIPDDPEEIEISETLIWYYDEEFENRFNTTDIIIEDLNLYGKIETINFNIKFKVDDEIYESIIYLKGSDLILPATPTKEELVFLGWYYDEEFENKFSLEDEIVEDIILYGKFSSGSGGGSIDDSDETKFKTEYIGYAALVLVGLVVVIGLVKAPKKRKKR